MAATDKPEPAQALAAKTGTDATFDSWLFRFWSWVTAKIDALFNADLVIGSSDPSLPNARVATDSASIDVDTGTANVIKWNLITEYAQDLVGAMLADSATIDFTYNDAAGTFTADFIGSTAYNSRSITQTSHGFAVGDVLYYTGSVYAKADADTVPTAEVVGIVMTVTSANVFVLLTDGYITGLSGLTAGTVYFLSGTAGALTSTEPTTNGAVSKPLLVADSTTSGYFINYRGQVIGGGVAGVREVTTGTATAGQTVITVAYTVGYVDVFVNGVRLQPADFTATNGTSITLATGMALNDEYLIVVWTVTSVTSSNLYSPYPPQGRLTLVTGSPVMTADATSQTTIYYSPYVGDLVPIYDGSAWTMKRFTELSIAMAGSANWAVTSNYDLFVINDAGTLRLVTGDVWTNATTRALGISRVNGLWVNSSSFTGRYGASNTVSVAANVATYVGTMRTIGSTGTTSWVVAPAAAAGMTSLQLLLWNCYNRVLAHGRTADSTASWTYATGTWRAANNSATARANFVRGLSEDSVSAFYDTTLKSSVVTTTGFAGVSRDFTDGTNLIEAVPQSAEAGFITTVASAGGHIYPSAGFHFVSALEYATAATITYYGGASGTELAYNSGIRFFGMF